MEKYLRGLDDETASNNNNNNCELAVNNNNENDVDMCAEDKKPQLSKWLESTANFMPSNYNIDFKNDKRKRDCKLVNNASLCEKELLAAETLVLLKNNFRTKFYNS